MPGSCLINNPMIHIWRQHHENNFIYDINWDDHRGNHDHDLCGDDYYNDNDDYDLNLMMTPIVIMTMVATII